MNRLMRKKTREVGDTEDAYQPSTAPSETALPVPKKKAWRWKKSKEEPEPQVNIATVLPTLDNFRTSLIMPNLSNRFSMLKEQEDPTSLLGKASDDSVLAPKRRSRLGDFGFTAAHLADIAEISSLRSHDYSRPSLAPQRHGSYTQSEYYSTADDDSTYGGSIMSRSRPGEGNMLFGGRQKIYRIPIGDSGAVKNLGNGESRGMRGRALYEDDVSMSAFQRLREEEKLRQAEERLAALEKDADSESISKYELNSPALSYNEKRETSSSINSGPSMLNGSTAPTSVAGSSPGLPPVTFLPSVPQLPEKAKSRKLYEQGLDQHFQEQQSAAQTRLVSLKRNTSQTGPYRSHSANNMHERYEKGAASVRNAVHMLEDNPASSSSSQHRPSIDQTGSQPRSSSNDDSENEKRNALWQCLDPNDRGMATAMGTFNKPKQFDEQQFLQRQMSLLQQQPKGRSNSTPKTPSTAPVNTLGDSARPRATTNRSDRSWSNSSPRKEPASFTTRKPVPKANGLSKSAEQSPTSASTGTFFAATDGDDESETESAKSTTAQSTESQNVDSSLSSKAPRSRQPPPCPILTHPALRSPQSSSPQSSSPQKNKEKRRAWSPDDLKFGLASADGIPKDYLRDLQNVDSESTEEQQFPEGRSDLKGLVREHLRHASNSSSVYPARTPGPEQTEFDIRAPSVYSTTGPWDADDKSPALPSLDPDLRHGDSDPFLNSDNRHPPSAAVADWEQELSRQHKREASSETTHERLAFASELAARQRTIQENLRFKAERGTPSPPSTARNVFENSLKPFSVLRNKSSYDTLPAGREPQGPLTNGSGSDRSSSRTRAQRDATISPPPLGRTLHSRLPGTDGDSTEAVFEYPRIPRPSIEDMRPSTADGIQRQGSSSTIPSRNPPSQSSPPQSSRTSMSKQRTASDASVHPPPADSTASIARPSLDTFRVRSNSSNTKESTATASPSRGRPPHPQLSGLGKISTSSPNISPRDAPGSATYSANSTPPLSAVSTPNLVSGTSTSASTNTQSSVANREQNIPTGFFFPPNTSRGNSKEISRTTGRGRKSTVNKDDISEPTLIASTSEVSTIELPPGASLQNGLRNDFDIVLLGASATSAAPAPTIPTGDKPRKGGLFSNFGRRDRGDRDELSRLPEDEPAPRRFRIKRMEAELGNGPSRPMHKAFMAGEGSVDGTMPSMY